MARGLKFWIKKEEGSYYLCRENKGADQLSGFTAKLICVFVFAYAKCLFSHDAAHLFGYYYMFVPLSLSLSLSLSLVQQRNLVFLY